MSAFSRRTRSRSALASARHILSLGGLLTLVCSPALAIDPVASSRAHGLPIEQRSFDQARDPVEDDTPGVLKYGAYCWRDVLVTKTSYRAVGRRIGGASVETVDHPPEYPYVVHDFFGTFRGANFEFTRGKHLPDARLDDGGVVEADHQWRFVDWTVSGSAVSAKMCVMLVSKGEGAYGGIAGWYRWDDSRISTVMVRFDQLDGLPVSLIDDLVKRFPSSVEEADFHGETWVADDVRKWVHLVELHQSDREALQLALSRIATYGRDLVGADAEELTSDDPSVFNAAVEALKRRADKWLAAREASKRGETGDGGPKKTGP